MFRKIALFCALVGALVLIAGSSYAEVQNIKVSGDIQALAIYRNNYDLEDRGWTNPLGSGLATELPNPLTEDKDSLFMSVVRLRVDADLTDNVSASVRLANLREWDTINNAAEDIYVDLAYVTLKEMLYSPLTSNKYLISISSFDMILPKCQIISFFSSLRIFSVYFWPVFRIVELLGKISIISRF